MNNMNPSHDQPRDNGRFDERVFTAPTTELSAVTELAYPAWSPNPSKAGARQDPAHSNNYIVSLNDGGQVSFDLRRESLDSHGFLDNLLLVREGDRVHAYGSATDVDFTAMFDGDEESGEWLTARQEPIREYLKDIYGVTDDDACDWDSSQLSVAVDISDFDVNWDGSKWDNDGLDDGADEDMGSEGYPRIHFNTADVIAEVWASNDGNLTSLRDDMEGGTFLPKLRTYLEANPNLRA